MEVYVVWEYYWGPESTDKYLYGIYSNKDKAESIVENGSKSRSYLSTWYKIEKRIIQD